MPGSTPAASAAPACSITAAGSVGNSVGSLAAPVVAISRTRVRKDGSQTSSASSIQASTCSVVGSSGSCAGIERMAWAMPAPWASGSMPSNAASTNSSIICWRSLGGESGEVVHQCGLPG